MGVSQQLKLNYKVKLTDSPTDLPQYLNDLLVAGDNVSLAIVNDQLEISSTGGGGSDTYKVKLDTDDATEDFLLSKLKAGDSITLTEVTDNGIQKIRLDVTGGVTDTFKVKVNATDSTEEFLEDKITITSGSGLTLATVNTGGVKSLNFTNNHQRDFQEVVTTSATITGTITGKVVFVSTETDPVELETDPADFLLYSRYTFVKGTTSTLKLDAGAGNLINDERYLINDTADESWATITLIKMSDTLFLIECGCGHWRTSAT